MAGPVSEAWKNAQLALALAVPQAPSKPQNSPTVSAAQGPLPASGQEWPQWNTFNPYANYQHPSPSAQGPTQYPIFNPFGFQPPPPPGPQQQFNANRTPASNFTSRQAVSFQLNPRPRHGHPSPSQQRPNVGSAWRPRASSLSSNNTTTSAPSTYSGITVMSHVSQPQFSQQPLTTCHTSQAPHTQTQHTPPQRETTPDQSQRTATPMRKQPAATEWPPELKSYVTRCFSSVTTDSEKDQMEHLLKAVITEAFAKDRVNTTDWSTFPIPLLQSRIPSQLMQKPTMVGRGRGNRGRTSRWGQSESVQKFRKAKVKNSRSRSRTPPKRKSTRPRSSSSSRSRPSSRSRSTSRSSSSHSSDSKVLSKDFIPLSSRLSKKIWNNSRNSGKTRASSRGSSTKGKRGMFVKRTRAGASIQSRIALPDKKNLVKRAARFGDIVPSRLEPLVLQINNYANDDSSDAVWDENHKIVGTCQNIEKEYLRLTSAPDASQVRPPEILRKSLQNVKRKWVEKADYRSTCEQFKSIRQDLTVQCIRDEFTVEVYEAHARVALEVADHEEFNQCQTQLKALYTDGLCGNHLEFAAYRILYYIFTQNSIDMIHALAALSSADKQDPCVSFALSFRSAWSLNNYHRMFSLYLRAPKMTGYLVDMFAERERIAALRTVVKAYRPSIDVGHVEAMLALNDRDKFLKFLTTQGVQFTDDGHIDCKQGLIVLQTPAADKS